MHSGALGWVAFISFGAIYYLVPVLWRRNGLYSTRLVRLALLDRHARASCFYIVSMWVAGIMEGLMWRAYDQLTASCNTPSSRAWSRCIRSSSSACSAALLFLIGALLMAFNLIMTVRSPSHRAGAAAGAPAGRRRRRREAEMMFIRQEIIETNAILLLVLTLVTVAIGGIVEIVPLFTIETTVEHVKGVRPYSPAGADGPRHLRARGLLSLPQPADPRASSDEVERYGHYSLAAESMYDHPFQWGSQAHRAGPGAGRRQVFQRLALCASGQPAGAGAGKPDAALRVPGARRALDYDDIAAHLRANRAVGVPYTDDDIANARADLEAQADAQADTAGLLKRYPKAVPVAGAPGRVTEMDALVAYLQVLGTMVNFADTSERTAAAIGGARCSSPRSSSGCSSTRSCSCCRCSC